MYKFFLVLIFAAWHNLTISSTEASNLNLSQFTAASDFNPRIGLPHINLNIQVDHSHIPFKRKSNREALIIAAGILDKVVNCKEFSLKLQQLSNGNSILTIDGKVRDLETHINDPSIIGPVTPLQILNYISAHKEQPPFFVTAYKKWNPFSTEVAVSDGNTLRFNNRMLSHNIVDLVGTLLHERLHYFGFYHEFLPNNGHRERKVPYYFGDLVQYLLSGLSQQQAATVFGITYPDGISWR